MATMRRGGHGLQRGMIGLALLVAVLGGLFGQPTGAAAAGERTFYGPSEDGCTYAWDGAQWVEKLCPLSDGTVQIFVKQGGQWVGFAIYDTYQTTTGCYYSDWAGDGYRQALCPQADGTWHSYVPGTNGQWVYDVKFTVKADGGFILEFANGNYGETYGDGSSYVRAANGGWATHDAAGNVIEQGGPSGSGSTEVAVPHEIFMVTSHARDFSNCLWLNDSSKDYDNDGRTGHNELVEHCS